MSFDVICIGSAKYDTLLRLDHQPAEDERVVTDRFINAAGGNANTASVAAARTGLNVALCTTLGQDMAGDYLLAQMESFGIDTRYVTRRADMSTPQSVNIANSASDTRSIITVNALPFQADAALQAAAGWFHFDAEGFRAAKDVIRAGKLAGRVSVDAGIAIGTTDLTGIDLYAPTESAILTAYGGSLETAMTRAVEAGARDVVVTLGGRGAAVLAEDEVRYIPTYKVDVISTLGAGDVFHGALVAQLARGLDLFRAVCAASVCAALSCRALDGQSAIPDQAELTDHLHRFEAAAHDAA